MWRLEDRAFMRHGVLRLLSIPTSHNENFMDKAKLGRALRYFGLYIYAPSRQYSLRLARSSSAGFLFIFELRGSLFEVKSIV